MLLQIRAAEVSVDLIHSPSHDLCTNSNNLVFSPLASSPNRGPVSFERLNVLNQLKQWAYFADSLSFQNNFKIPQKSLPDRLPPRHRRSSTGQLNSSMEELEEHPKTMAICSHAINKDNYLASIVRNLNFSRA